MTIITTDVNLFQEVAKLPSEIIAIIIGYLPKCVLPELLYFPPIKKHVASTILSDVNITDYASRHEAINARGIDYDINCSCNRYQITLINLKKGIAQWNVYPKAIHINGKSVFESILNTFPRLLKEALSINGSLDRCRDLELETLLNLFLDSNIRFDFLELSDAGDAVTLPPIATNVKLRESTLNSYLISGVKKLNIDVDSEVETIQTNFLFSTDLEDLQIESLLRIQVNLPPNLRKLSVAMESDSASFVSEELVYLEYLQLKLPENQSFSEIGIIAPNLKVLFLEDCLEMTDFDSLKQYPHLKHLTMNACAYPFDLFNESSFPELESFEYDGYGFEDPENFTNPLLIFPTNLKQLSIKCGDFANVDLDKLVLPPTLTRLKLLGLAFKNGYFHLGENLQFVHIETSRLTFNSSFQIPHMAEEFILQAEYLTFEGLDFVYHLPTSLTRLHLIAQEQGKISPITKKIKWPLVLGSFELQNFGLGRKTLRLLNLKESRLGRIYICGGKIKKLDVDLFPTCVKDLTLLNTGIQKLPASFERFNNLRKLSLMGNQLNKVNSVKLPVSSLDNLDVSYCSIDLISPFLVSMYEEKNKNAKIRVVAMRNLNVNVGDVKKAIKAIEGLYLSLNGYDKTLRNLSQKCSRLWYVYDTVDLYFEMSKFSGIGDIIPYYDSDDIYY